MDKLLSTEEVAELLGVKVCTIYAMTSERRIPFIRVGGRKLGFRPAAIERWLREQERQPVNTTRPS